MGADQPHKKTGDPTMGQFGAHLDLCCSLRENSCRLKGWRLMKSKMGFWLLDKSATSKADEALWSRHPDLKRRRLDFSVNDAKYRREWMDLYLSYGGKATAIGKTGIRIAPIIFENELTQKTDEVFWASHPRLNRRKLTLKTRDSAFRTEWLDIYVRLGGKVVEIGDSGVRIPASCFE